jgi:hypothetical protein
MTGTTGSSFNGLLATDEGKLGYRNIGGASYRVRVETGNAVPLPFTSKGAHYSTVVEGEAALAEAIAVGAAAIAGGAIPAPVAEEKVLALPNGSEIRVYEETRQVVEIDGEELSPEQVSDISNFLAALQ